MNHQAGNSLQYMQDVGISPADVAWLADHKRSSTPATPAERARALQIEEAAYFGLLGTITKRPQVSAACQ